MHESCICQAGDECHHEAFVFSVGETARGTVEIALYRPNGYLSVLAVAGFTSWKKSRGADRIPGKRSFHGFSETALVDRIVRQEHGLTIECDKVALLFFGPHVRLTTRDVAAVEPPRIFGDKPGIEYRKRYMKHFLADSTAGT